MSLFVKPPQLDIVLLTDKSILRHYVTPNSSFRISHMSVLPKLTISAHLNVIPENKNRMSSKIYPDICCLSITDIKSPPVKTLALKF